VGEYHVDVLSTGRGGKHNDFFGAYQYFLAGKDAKAAFVSTTRQPGYQGMHKSYGSYGAYNFLTGGWYSFPSLGQCRRGVFGQGICRWTLRRRPRLVHFDCVQERLYAAVFRGSGSSVTFDERQSELSVAFRRDRMLLNRKVEWNLALEAFLSSFDPQGGCPEVEPNEWACCCRALGVGRSACDGVGEDGAPAVEHDGKVVVSVIGMNAQLLSFALISRVRTNTSAMTA